MTTPASSIKQLEVLLAASYKLVFLCTQEEPRAEEELRRVAEGGARFKTREYFSWTETDGFLGRDGKPVDGSKKTNDPMAALDWIVERERRRVPHAMYVMKDLHPFIHPRTGRSTIVRKVKDVLRVLEGQSFSALVMLSGPHMELPPELEKEAMILDFELPTPVEIRERLVEFIGRYKGKQGVKIDLDDEGVDAIAKAAQGLTMAEAELAFAKALTTDLRLNRDDVRLIIEDKRQIIRKTGILTFEEPDDFNNVGGLENLKSWLRLREHILTQRARDYGIPEPKGVMLTGIPGCGKSLCAKAMASFWKVPLLRLDMGAIFAGIVGSSEANMRKAIRCAEAMAPCVLMIDEIEKGLAGMGGGGGDGGTSSRVFGTLLSWMNDKTCPVFVVATANEFDRLPPEMLRKGRFDEIFFVDFPHAEERRNIFLIHVKKRRRDPARYNLEDLVASSENLTGSEIEQAIISGMIQAFADGGREFRTEDILDAIDRTIPLFDTMRDKIASIRQRSKDFTVDASRRSSEDDPPSAPDGGRVEGAAPSSGGRQVDFGNGSS